MPTELKLDDPNRKIPFRRRRKKNHDHAGQPTKYRPEYCHLILTHFNVPSQNTLDITITKPDGTREEKQLSKPVLYPMLIDFCESIDISEHTHFDWVRDHPEYAHAWNKCKAHQKRILIQNGLAGEYDARIVQFVAINDLDMVSAKDEVKMKGVNKECDEREEMKAFSTDQLNKILSIGKTQSDT